MPITIEHNKHIKVNTARPNKLIGLADATLDKFCAAGIIRRFSKREVVYTVGAPADRVYYLASGSLSLVMPSSNGAKKFIIAHIQAGDFVGEAAFTVPGNKVRNHALVADEVSELIEVPVATLNQLMTSDMRDCAHNLILSLAAQSTVRFDMVLRKMSCMADSGVRGRIVQAITDLSNEPKSMSHPDGVQIKISRQDLARLCGCSREMAGRVLKQLQDEGFLSANGKTVVVFRTKE